MSGNKVNEKKEKIEMLMIRGIRGAMEVKRILVHAYVNKNQKDIKHQYLDKTIRLRPDL